MSLQWYPGHMTKALRELVALMPSQDVVIEVLDGRLPKASSNPVVTELRGSKPVIKVLTKSDLADPEVTRAWVTYLEGEPDVKAFASTTERPEATRKRIAELSRHLADHRGPGKDVRALIAGVPNVHPAGADGRTGSLTAHCAPVSNGPTVVEAPAATWTDWSPEPQL